MAHELDEHALGQAVRVGVMIGIPVIFVVVALASLLAGQGVSRSLQVAAWPALVGGPYMGGFFSLLSAQARADHTAEVYELPAAAPRPSVERRAA